MPPDKVFEENLTEKPKEAVEVGDTAGRVPIASKMDERREDTRTTLAYVIVIPTILIALALVGFALKEGAAQTVKDIAIPTFTAMLGVAGTVLGFYFGAGGSTTSSHITSSSSSGTRGSSSSTKPKSGLWPFRRENKN